MKNLLSFVIIFSFGCSLKSKKSVCDYGSGLPNARFVMIGSCVKTNRPITGFQWVETTDDGHKITQGHLIIETLGDGNGGSNEKAAF